MLKTEVDPKYCKEFCSAGRFIEKRGCAASGGEECPNKSARRKRHGG
jgi:hypothetical protein